MSTRLTKGTLCILGTCIFLLNALTTPSEAQTFPAWNRKVEAFSVPLTHGGPTGLFDIQAFLSFSADADTGPLDLATEMVMMMNGEPYSVQSLVPQTGSDDLVATEPAVPLQPGDEIMVLLRPSPGAAPEPNQADRRVSKRRSAV